MDDHAFPMVEAEGEQSADGGHMRAGHRVREPKRCPSTTGPEPVDRTHADRCAPADPGPESARESIIRVHQPHRPDWLCNACRAPWPCGPYRQHIVPDSPTSQLAILMASWMTEAVGDLPESTPGALWDRFLAWTHRPPLEV
ncbi:hypothetical protein KRMM14A1259_26870 [Krasilnikovia sp. MM14-A1259]